MHVLQTGARACQIDTPAPAGRYILNRHGRQEFALGIPGLAPTLASVAVFYRDGDTRRPAILLMDDEDNEGMSLSSALRWIIPQMAAILRGPFAPADAGRPEPKQMLWYGYDKASHGLQSVVVEFLADTAAFSAWEPAAACHIRSVVELDETHVRMDGLEEILAVALQIDAGQWT